MSILAFSGRGRRWCAGDLHNVISTQEPFKIMRGSRQFRSSLRCDSWTRWSLYAVAHFRDRHCANSVHLWLFHQISILYGTLISNSFTNCTFNPIAIEASRIWCQLLHPRSKSPKGAMKSSLRYFFMLTFSNICDTQHLRCSWLIILLSWSTYH